MAEAFPEEPPTDSSKTISVLLLATKWQFDTYGLSTVNKSLVNNLRVVDPEGKAIKITCAVAEEERNITDDQRRDATKCHIKLKGGKPPRGPKKKPSLEWLDQNIATYYPELLRKDNYDFVISHVPYLANGALNFRDLYPETKPKPKVILMIHELPKTTEGDSDEDMLREWLSEADIVFSVGKKVESGIISSIKSLGPEQRPIHKLYIPTYPLELLNVQRDITKKNKISGNQIITLMTGERRDLEINGLDFPLAVLSAAGASKQIQEIDDVKTNFDLLTVNEEDKKDWKKEFFEVVQNEELKGTPLNFRPDSPETIEKLKIHLRGSNLFILPLKPDSPLFGTEALSAAAAAVPILVSGHSGIASLLQSLCQDQSVVKQSTLQSDRVAWKEGIIKKLGRPEEAQRHANILRKQLILNTTIAETHLDFTRTVINALSVPLEMELTSDPVVPQEHLNKISPELGNQTTPVEAKKYVQTFIQKLLLQREKIDLGILTDYLDPSDIKLWQETLSTLENSSRKLLAVESRSLIFTLFCPTTESRKELRDDSWIESLTLKMKTFIKKIGLKPQLRIQPPKDDNLPTDTKQLSGLRELMLRHKAGSELISEGYVTQHSSDIASEKQGDGTDGTST